MPAASTNPIDVCNLALFNVGSSQQINDLDERTAEAKACKRLYASVRDSCLQRHWWSFAKKRHVLAELNRTITGWDFVYSLPHDYLAARFIWSGERDPQNPLKVPFDIESISVLNDVITNRCLVTDQAEAELVYTAECPTVALWSPLFVEAVAWEMAGRLNLVLPVSEQKATKAKAMGVLALREAFASDLRSRQPDPQLTTASTRAR